MSSTPATPCWPRVAWPLNRKRTLLKRAEQTTASGQNQMDEMHVMYLATNCFRNRSHETNNKRTQPPAPFTDNDGTKSINSVLKKKEKKKEVRNADRQTERAGAVRARPSVRPSVRPERPQHRWLWEGCVLHPSCSLQA